MKSQRDILLEKHRHQNTSLDAIRKGVVADELTAGKQATEAGLLETLIGWFDLKRVAWSTLAAIWIAILSLNAATHLSLESESGVPAHANTREVLEGLKSYQSRLASLLDESNPEEVEPESNEEGPSGPLSEADRRRKSLHLSTPQFA